MLRALISCGACRLTCGVRQTQAGYRYYQCRGRTDPLRAAPGPCTPSGRHGDRWGIIGSRLDTHSLPSKDGR